LKLFCFHCLLPEILFLQKHFFVIRIQQLSGNKSKILFAGFLIIAFFFRLVYGLFSEFWLEDELQVYLIGLKFYASGILPHWGPDVVYTQTQLPGSLQGLLVGGPLFILPVPEAPYFLLNLLSFSSLCLLALYIRKRIPEIPSWFVWIWVLSCPWTINYSTHVVNPSYVLPAAVLFFIGFFEVLPNLRIGFMGSRPAMFLIGFSFFWIFQLHKSWVLLIPFTIIALWYGIKNRRSSLLTFFLGCLVTGSSLIPVVMDYLRGDAAGIGESAVVFNPKNAGNIVTVLSRYLSFASFELPIFMGPNGQARIEFIKSYYLFSPFIIAAALIGLAQPVYLAAAFFIKNPSSSFRMVKWLVLFTFLMVWLSFFFSIKGPSSHTYYLVFPLVMIYSMYCWLPLFRKNWFRMLMIGLLFAGAITHSALAHRNLKTKSLYLNREKPVEAIKEKNYHILGERRAFDRNP